MASHLDLEEQEQLEQLKAFWKRWGNTITSLVTLGLLAYVGWMGWNYWQRTQGAKASVVFSELERAVQAGDLAKGQGMFATLKADYASTGYAGQGALLTAKLQLDKGKPDDARATLVWAAADAKDDAQRDLARLRLAGLQMDAKQLDEAGKTLDGVKGADFAPLLADRRGDLALLQNKPDVAKTEFKKAYDGLEKQLDYRRIVEVKLASLGVAVAEEPQPGAAQ
ncbi:YfgM family protein [Roseateles amylovorans]|uniref:Ancillary SecYEG translocon subunit n=1 Tax=Roseateles amylovorans TaxID=2978473 RepID=A0ABY6AXD1_9BURK|nr:tetratricopeptide repeat protein [Roseateles amylovorans]UXH77064.1 tetratricopeptide repeat protein [Roseateles amylovorans]